jgi:SAM-dependent methyltransferase
MGVVQTGADEFLTVLRARAHEQLAAIEPNRSDLREQLTVYLNEAPVALDLLKDLGPNVGAVRVLEVGGGIGAVAACLAHLGFDVVAIEPGGPGFQDVLVLQRAVEAALAELPLPSGSRIVHPIGVEDLDPGVHGVFDVVLSANVLEHVRDPLLALDRMQAVLAKGGVQTHVCPNYAFPYEPHFFVPLLPFRPSATRWLLPRSMTETGLWASLNFVTAWQVRRWASRSGVEVRFARGVLADALDRFVSDPVFAQRHGRLGAVVSLLRRLGLVGLVRRLPAGLVSPMRFTVTAAPSVSAAG